MIFTAEFLLVAGVIAFYLQDSALLLHYDELALVQAGPRWRASVGSGFQWQGRHLFLPNPFLPARAIFRCGWLSEPQRREHWPGLDHHVAALEAFKPGCRIVWALLLVALPALLWRYPHPLALLALAVSIYLVVAFQVLQLWRYRRVLELPARALASLGFEILCCPPYAINLVRRLSLRRGLHGDAIAAVRRMAEVERFREVRELIDGRIAMALDFQDADVGGEGDVAVDPRLMQARHRLELLG